MKRSNSTTERLFRTAGICKDMTVLELGSGPGEITELLCDIVGSNGHVFAVDCSQEMISSTQQRLENAGRKNVSFLQADLNQQPEYLQHMDLGVFDAVVGRRVLMYLPNPDRVLAGLSPWLREEGIVVFEEFDSTMTPGFTSEMPAHARGASLLAAMLTHEGVDLSMGLHLPATFANAGLNFKAIWAEAIIDGQGDQYRLGELIELMKPRLASANLATVLEIEQLVAQIAAEIRPENVFISGMRFCAKACKQ